MELQTPPVQPSRRLAQQAQTLPAKASVEARVPSELCLKGHSPVLS